jgi:hypothetical protein
VQRNALPRGRWNVCGRNPLCRAVVDRPLSQVQSENGSGGARRSDLSKVHRGSTTVPTRGEARRRMRY